MQSSPATETEQNTAYAEPSALMLCNRKGIPGSDGPLNIISTSGQAPTLNMFQEWNCTYYPYYSYNVLVLAQIKIGLQEADQTSGPTAPIAPDIANNFKAEQTTKLCG